MIPNDSFGLNLSHLISQMIDNEREGLYNDGVLSQGMGRQVPRRPGRRRCRLAKIFAAITAAHYDYVVSIEHKDRVFAGDEDLVRLVFYL